MKSRREGNWRYGVIKKYARRVEKFILQSDSYEEYLAWNIVRCWFQTILDKKYLNAVDVIVLPLVGVDTTIKEEWDELEVRGG